MRKAAGESTRKIPVYAPRPWPWKATWVQLVTGGAVIPASVAGSFQEGRELTLENPSDRAVASLLTMARAGGRDRARKLAPNVAEGH